jgi:hypothetical protein
MQPRSWAKDALLRFYTYPQALSIGITSGGAVEEFQYDIDDGYPQYAQVFIGGHVYDVDPDTEALLTAAGYGAGITEPPDLYDEGLYDIAFYA